MDLRHMLAVCGITYIWNPAGNRSTKLFIDSQGFMGIHNFTILHIEDIPHMIKYHNLGPIQEARLGNI